MLRKLGFLAIVGLLILLTACNEDQNSQAASLLPAVSPTTQVTNSVTTTSPTTQVPSTSGLASIPDEAMLTIRQFMEVRIARDEQKALSYMTPELKPQIHYEQLLPASSPRWLSYTVSSVQPVTNGAIDFSVQINLAAAPIGREVNGLIEQSARLEYRDKIWLVSKLTDLKVLTAPGTGKVYIPLTVAP